MTAREEVLERIRAAIAPLPTSAPPVAAEVAREYRMQSADGIDTFIDRLHHYQAQTHRAPAGRLEETIRAVLADRNASRMVVPEGVPEAWVQGLDPLRDSPPLDVHALDRADGVITTCAVAIAQSGTIVLDGGPGMGRRILSLVPDYHLCIVGADQIVGSLPEALPRLEPTHPLTFISGPSATVDIEMVRVRGVHGPRRLEVIVAE